jgi:hypothetical protein
MENLTMENWCVTQGLREVPFVTGHDKLRPIHT